MADPTSYSTSWSTASFGHDAETSPMELSALGLHLKHCKEASGRWFAARCVADAVHAFVAGRMVTTWLVVALLLATGLWMA